MLSYINLTAVLSTNWFPMICMHSLYSFEDFLIYQSDPVQLLLKSVLNMDMKAPVHLLGLLLLWFPGKIGLKWGFYCYTVVIDWNLAEVLYYDA